MGLNDVQIQERLERGLEQCIRSSHLLPLFSEGLSGVQNFPCTRILKSPPLLSAACKGQGWDFLEHIFQKSLLRGCIESIWPICYSGEFIFWKNFIFIIFLEQLKVQTKILEGGTKISYKPLPPQKHAFPITTFPHQWGPFVTIDELR